MAYSLEQLTALEAALARGERRVTFADKSVEYRSVEELKSAIREIKRDMDRMDAQSGLWPKAPRQIHVNTTKGF
jgi:hypothetical protein